MRRPADPTASIAGPATACRLGLMAFVASALAVLAASCTDDDQTRAETSGRCTYEPGKPTPPRGWKGVDALGWAVYASSRGDAPGDLYVSRGDGSAPRRLTRDPRDEYSASWSPDGSRVAFRVEAAKEGTDADIWVVDADGSDRRNLTRTRHRAEWSPAWSPDGSRIAYFAASERLGGDIYVMNEYPSWSPDGEWIAYLSYSSSNFEISRIKADGSCHARLTRESEADTWASWSPDGQRIAFVSDRSGARELYTMRPDGTDVRRLTNTPEANENYPSWTVDGHIAYVTEQGDLFKAERWVINADGSSRRKLRGPGNLFSQMSWTRRVGG